MNREILRLAIPNIISNVSVPLLSTVDTALMGRLSEWHIGAVGVGAMIFNFIYWNFGFLRMGTTGIAAQAFGRRDDSGLAVTLGRALAIVLALAAALILLQWPLREASIYLMNIQGRQIDLVGRYFDIRIWAAPATLGLYAMMGWFFGMQNAIYPLVLTVFINILNIGLSVLFVREYGMDVDGVAYGTLIAQYAGMVLALGLFYYRYGYLLPHFRRRAILLWEELQRFLRLNFDIFVRTLCLTFGFGFFYSQSASEGEIMLAVNVILLQLINWMSYGVDGFAFASEALVGKYAGAEDAPRTRRAITYTFAWGMALALLFSLAYWQGGQPILRLFTDQSDVLRAARPFLLWMAFFPLLSTPSYLWDGVFIGLTASRSMRNTMLLAFAIYLLTYFLFGRQWGNHGLWLSLLAFMLARGAIQYLFFRWEGLELR